MGNILVSDLRIFLCRSDSFSFQFIFQSLEDKRAKADMISSTIELMVKKEDFSKLEDVCTMTSKSTPGFHRRLRDSLKSVPLNVIENLNLNLDPEVKTKLQLDVETIHTDQRHQGQKASKESNKNYEDFTTKLAEENLEEVSSILLKVRISDLIHIFKGVTL